MDHRSLHPARRVRRIVSLAGAAGFLAAGIAWAQDGYRDTPFIVPGGKWRVHDADRPQPREVDPGYSSTQEVAGKAPSDAVVLFDGKDMSKWQGGNGAAPGWKVENGYAEVNGGAISTREEFGDMQLHVEFATPNPPKGKGQGRGNSGIFLFDGRYEIQVLDTYKSPTYADGGAGALYGQYPPLVNASRKPGDWQTMDIMFTAPRFDGDKLVKPAYTTVLHNGVAVHVNTEVLGFMNHRTAPKYSPHPLKGRIGLQDHGDKVRFRNIWVREIKGYDEP